MQNIKNSEAVHSAKTYTQSQMNLCQPVASGIHKQGSYAPRQKNR